MEIIIIGGSLVSFAFFIFFWTRLAAIQRNTKELVSVLKQTNIELTKLSIYAHRNQDNLAAIRRNLAPSDYPKTDNQD